MVLLFLLIQQLLKLLKEMVHTITSLLLQQLVIKNLKLVLGLMNSYKTVHLLQNYFMINVILMNMVIL